MYVSTGGKIIIPGGAITGSAVVKNTKEGGGEYLPQIRCNGTSKRSGAWDISGNTAGVDPVPSNILFYEELYGVGIMGQTNGDRHLLDRPYEP